MNTKFRKEINPLNAELNPICHLLALLGAHNVLHVSRIWVNISYLIFPSTVTGWWCRCGGHSCRQITHEPSSLTEIRGSECHHQTIVGRLHTKGPGSAVDMCVGHAGISAR